MELLKWFLLSLVFSCAICTCTPALAAFQNGSFEAGDFGGWQTLGAHTVESSLSFGVPPTDGSYQALLQSTQPGFFGRPASELETFLAIAPGTLDNLGNGTTVQGSAIRQTISVQAGDMLSFDWNFLTNEDSVTNGGVANDFAFVSIGPTQLTTLGSASSSAFTASPVPDYINATDFQKFSYTFSSGGTYSIGVGVVDVDDAFSNSALAVDNFSLTPQGGGTSVPLPAVASSGLILLMLVIAASVLSKRILRRR